MTSLRTGDIERAVAFTATFSTAGGGWVVPIYEYRCDTCGAEFEQLILRPTQVACSRCHGTRVERLLSRFAQRRERGFVASVGSACGPCAASSCGGCSLKRAAA